MENKFTFCFQGYVRNAQIQYVTVNTTGKIKNVSKYKPETIVKNLNNGKWSISLADFIDCSYKTEIELFDFDTEGL